MQAEKPGQALTTPTGLWRWDGRAPQHGPGAERIRQRQRLDASAELVRPVPKPVSVKRQSGFRRPWQCARSHCRVPRRSNSAGAALGDARRADEVAGCADKPRERAEELQATLDTMRADGKGRGGRSDDAALAEAEATARSVSGCPHTACRSNAGRIGLPKPCTLRVTKWHAPARPAGGTAQRRRVPSPR